MNKVLKLQRVGLITPTLVEYDGKVLATNQLDIESTCNLWRCHFGFYPTEKIDLAMTKKEFSVIQQKTISSVKSVYDLFYEQNFIPRVFESKEEVSEWGMYRTNEVEKLKAENASLHEKFAALNKMPCNIGDTVYVLFGSCYRCEDYEGDYCSCEKRGKDKIFEMKVGSVRFDKDNYYLYEDPTGITSGLSCSGRNYGKTWFLGLEEAKNHLMKAYDDVIQQA